MKKENIKKYLMPNIHGELYIFTFEQLNEFLLEFKGTEITEMDHHNIWQKKMMIFGG